MLVHGLNHALAALELAGPRGVLLISPPGAAARAGAGWFLALVAQARHAFPDVPCDAALDCGPWAGIALGAIRAGARIVILSPDCRALPRLAAAAGEAGVALWTERPAVLDLAGYDSRRRADRARLSAWLSAIGSPREQGMPPAR